MLTIKRDLIADSLRWFAAWPEDPAREANGHGPLDVVEIKTPDGIPNVGAEALVAEGLASFVSVPDGWVRLTDAGKRERDRLYPERFENEGKDREAAQ